MSERAAMLAVGSSDPVLHHLAPLGLGAAAGTALVIDLDPDGPSLPGPTVASLLEEGVRRIHLAPSRAGVAVIGNGGADPQSASDLVSVLARGWPTVVLRVGEHHRPECPMVPVVPILPGPLTSAMARPAVYQRTFPGGRLPGPGLALPPIGRAMVTMMLRGRIEPRWRWVRAWRRVWSVRWE